jgi:hypothetical protein
VGVAAVTAHADFELPLLTTSLSAFEDSGSGVRPRRRTALALRVTLIRGREELLCYSGVATSSQAQQRTHSVAGWTTGSGSPDVRSRSVPPVGQRKNNSTLEWAMTIDH